MWTERLGEAEPAVRPAVFLCVCVSVVLRSGRCAVFRRVTGVRAARVWYGCQTVQRPSAVCPLLTVALGPVPLSDMTWFRLFSCW